MPSLSQMSFHCVSVTPSPNHMWPFSWATVEGSVATWVGSVVVEYVGLPCVSSE